MAGLTFGGGLFPSENLYDDTGRLLSISDSESAGRERTLIVKSGNGTTGTNTLYTVAAGKRLFVTSMWIAATNLSTTEKQVRITNDAEDPDYLGLDLGTIDGQSLTNSLTFPQPVIVIAGDKIKLQGLTNAPTSGGFYGWLEDA